MSIPKHLNLKNIYRLYIIITFVLMFILSIVVSTIRVDALLSSSNNAVTNYPQIVLRASEFKTQKQIKQINITNYKSCDGNWIDSEKTGRVNLEVTSLNQWATNSNPTIISESIQNQNKVIIGHNYCLNGSCNSPGTEFSRIINLSEGEPVKVCINQNEFNGKVYVAKSFSEYDTYIMSDWLKQPSVTLFTSYGNCKDAACSASDRRWVIGAVEAKR